MYVPDISLIQIAEIQKCDMTVKMHISTNTTILLSKIVAWVHKFYLKYMRVWILAVLKILELFRLNFPIFVYKTGISFPLFCVILIYTFKCFLKVTE